MVREIYGAAGKENCVMRIIRDDPYLLYSHVAGMYDWIPRPI